MFLRCKEALIVSSLFAPLEERTVWLRINLSSYVFDFQHFPVEPPASTHARPHAFMHASDTVPTCADEPRQFATIRITSPDY